jgi:hypothetical protein
VPSEPLKIEELVVIGENDYGWRFAVGRIGERWLGLGLESANTVAARCAFRDEGLPVEPGYMHVIGAVSRDHELGLPDKEAAIRLTGAIAQDPAHAFGGVERWLVPEALRGRPDDFRCGHCEEVGCNGDCQDADYDVREEP